MNMNKRLAILSTLFLLIAPCAMAQDAAQSTSAVQDTLGPSDFVPVDKEPEIVKQVLPKYPELAQKAGIEGRIVVKVLVDKDGSPKKVIILKSSNEIFNQPSIDAAMKYRFSPAIYRDNPVAVWVVIPFTYKLKPSPVPAVNDTSLAGKYRKEMMDASMRSESYEQMIKTYDLGMYYERKKDYAKALKTYRDFIKKSKDFPDSPEEMVRYAKAMIKKHSRTQSSEK